VEFVGRYKDYSRGGSGEFEDWQYIYWKTDDNISHHIGTAQGAERSVMWENAWIPEQKGVSIAARVRDQDGMYYMTAAVEDIRLTHGHTIVRMYPAADVPESFAQQVGRKACKIAVADPQDEALDARILVSTFSGGHDNRAVYLNGTKIEHPGNWGIWHQVDICDASVPTQAIRQGDNTFELSANEGGQHAFEINWPGPVLFVSYTNPNPVAVKATAVPGKARVAATLRTGMLSIDNPIGGDYTVRVTTLGGKSVITKRGNGTCAHYSLPVDLMAQGLYLVRVSAQRHQAALRLVVSE
jgi:hypothetical protein